MFDTAEQAYGGVDVLVNNAGIMQLAPIAQADDEFFDRQVAINLKGVFNGMREAASLRAGAASSASRRASSACISRPTGLCRDEGRRRAMSHVLAKEMRGRNITVNVVAPGPTGTDLFLHGKSPELVEQLSKLAPLERLGRPDDIAGVVSFLAGPDGAWVNGQVLRANGGVI